MTTRNPNDDLNNVVKLLAHDGQCKHCGELDGDCTPECFFDQAMEKDD